MEESIPLTIDVIKGTKRQILSIRMPVAIHATPSIDVEKGVGKHTAVSPPVTFINEIDDRQSRFGDHDVSFKD